MSGKRVKMLRAATRNVFVIPFLGHRGVSQPKNRVTVVHQDVHYRQGKHLKKLWRDFSIVEREAFLTALNGGN